MQFLEKWFHVEREAMTCSSVSIESHSMWEFIKYLESGLL